MEENCRKKLIGAAIRTRRELLGMTQEELGAKMGLDQSNLSNIENGKTFPSFSTLCAIIEILNIEPNEFLKFLNFSSTQSSTRGVQTPIDVEIYERLKYLSTCTKQNLLEIIKKLKD